LPVPSYSPLLYSYILSLSFSFSSLLSLSVSSTPSILLLLRDFSVW
jgi:hypothetical protein